MSHELLFSAASAIQQGLFLTLAITCCSFFLGQILALPIAIALVSRSKWVRWPAKSYTFAIRGSPLLVQLFIVYYGFAQIDVIRESVVWPIVRSAFYCSIIAISANSAAYSAELLAGAIKHVPRGQWEAANSLGLSSSSRLFRIVLPQAYRAILPSISNELILVMKSSTLASAVTVLEMTGAARVFVARSYAPFEAFLIIGIAYLAIGAVFGSVGKVVERRLAIPAR